MLISYTHFRSAATVYSTVEGWNRFRIFLRRKLTNPLLGESAVFLVDEDQRMMKKDALEGWETASLWRET